MGNLARRPDRGESRRHVEFPAEARSLPEVGRELFLFVREAFGEPYEAVKEIHDLRLALQEACANLIEHGRVEGQVFAVEFSRVGDELQVDVVSRGCPFDPTRASRIPPDPEDLAEGGYGIFLLHQLTDGVTYTTQDGTNTLSLVKRLAGTEDAR